MDAGQCGGFYDPCRVCLAEAGDVLGNGAVEQLDVLRQVAQVWAQHFCIPLADLGTIRTLVKESGLPVIYDGGIRRGTDVLKAYALGASFVFVGRPMLCAAAVRGQPGVERAIDLLQEEIHRDLALIGANSMADLGPQFLQYLPHAR